ncbi:MAG: hypothetical protein JJU11_03775 [Candidatus Sumerlaeia bacterium]|nr:hypothetical protein [Candidatus Sumerlaeia bacterium]
MPTTLRIYLLLAVLVLATGAQGSFNPVKDAPGEPEILPVNVLLDGRELNAAKPEDWYRVYIDGRDSNGVVAAIPYVLALSGVALPPESALHVTAFTDGVPATPPTAEECVFSTDDILCEVITDPSREIILLSNGFDALQQVDIRVALLGDTDGTTTYSLSVYRSTGANNGIVSNIGTITQNKGNGIVGIVTLETDDYFVAGRSDSTYGNLDAIRLYRSIAFMASGAPFDPMTRFLVDEWDASKTPFPNCQVMEGSLAREIANAVTLWDESLPDFGGQAATVLYFIDVVIDGQEVPANMAANPTVASYIPGQMIQAPTCTPATTPVTLDVNPSEAAVQFTMFEQSRKTASFTLNHNAPHTLSWSAEANASWLELLKTGGELSGGTPGTLNVSIHPGQVPRSPGIYTGTIQVTAPELEAPRLLTVTVERLPHSDLWTIE